MDSVHSRDTKSIVSFLGGLREEVRPSVQCSSCCALNIPWSPVADGSCPTVVVKMQHESGPPDLTQPGVSSSVPDLRLLTKGGTPYTAFTCVRRVIPNITLSIELDENAVSVRRR
ncbi:hypothetical protein ANCDUO_11737 [Ancylostoma duodenale]|uniref:Uncharacterized protein n=1 Tax=Ancylostoma duodenale TaxID=51022 RepID=A0A0C2CN08_9BILA|nr:hypothetical protein ANCDUO_11737 [Ancylostoma duodenale]